MDTYTRQLKDEDGNNVIPAMPKRIPVPDYANMYEISVSQGTNVPVPESGWLEVFAHGWNGGGDFILDFRVGGKQVWYEHVEATSSSGVRAIWDTRVYPVAKGNNVWWDTNATMGELHVYVIPVKFVPE